ncbi:MULTISPECIES: thioesterase family protein [Streptomyces]|uniref:Thioesterase family protein n=1 Tax=Streptomyces caniscabiei TaxID=2746961 RepID=A0ABU4N051_9ACTN|nr:MULTISPECIES: thioesterase family protein [Streptomyces]MBE4735545.1 thioesterase family protein [Streptomyces caniscabiei]MBE4758158.1 thioesterase family protein [Streptomyces caniscabiei]MBE4774727.1 thioesterase family protein [Streptomyces caniscabiei]MBE4789485.1 thioesterase family protein [Streptomyces caniscabiei]MBE4795963.1 thioesterase family protein [Streptomyces caniscabiei]
MPEAASVQATVGDSEFDRDTALTRRAPGVYDIDLSAGWTIIGAVNGGYLLAVLGRALADALPHDDPFTISAYYLTASQPGPAVVRTDVVRTGRTLSTGQASLFQYDDEGREIERIRVLASYGDLDSLPADVRTTAKPPAMPPIDECFGPQDAPGPVPGGSAIADRLFLKLDPATLGWALGAPSGKGEMRSWFGLADGRDADPFSLLLAVDALPPTAFEMGLKGWVPTVELTVHIRCRPAPGPLRVAITTRNLAGGFLEEDAEVWDSADRLVAQSRQLARARLSD